MRLLLLSGMLLLAACSGKVPARTSRPPASVPPASPSALLSEPCKVAAALRAGAPGLIASGRLERALRDLNEADYHCPSSTHASCAPVLDALVALDRIEDARLLAARVENDPASSAEALAAAARARKAQPDPRTGQDLLDAALAAEASNPVEAQFLFERAAVHFERELGQRFAFIVKNGVGVSSGLPWFTYGTGADGGHPIEPEPAMSHDLKLVAFGDGTHVLVFDRAARRIKLWIKADQRKVTALAWSSDDKLLASGGEMATVNVWNAETGARVMVGGHRAELGGDVAGVATALRFLDHDRELACAHQGTSVWDVSTGRKLGGFGPPGEGIARAIDPYGIATVAVRGTNRSRYDVMTGKPVPGPIPVASTSTPDGTLEALAFKDAIELRHHPGPRLHRRIPSRGFVLELALSSDGKWLAVGKAAERSAHVSRVEVHDATSGRLVGAMALTKGPGHRLSGFTANGELVIVNLGKEVVVDPTQGTEVRTLADNERLSTCGSACDVLDADALRPSAIALRSDGGMVAFSGVRSRRLMHRALSSFCSTHVPARSASFPRSA